MTRPWSAGKVRTPRRAGQVRRPSGSAAAGRLDIKECLMVTALLVIALAVAPAPTYDGPILTGTVRASGRPADGAEVWLVSFPKESDLTEAVAATTTTDRQGQFRLPLPDLQAVWPYGV